MPSDDLRYSGLRTILRVAKRIEHQRSVNLRGLAEDFGVHHRTMRRYLMALEGAGWPVPPWRQVDLEGR